MLAIEPPCVTLLCTLPLQTLKKQQVKRLPKLFRREVSVFGFGVLRFGGQALAILCQQQ